MCVCVGGGGVVVVGVSGVRCDFIKWGEATPNPHTHIIIILLHTYMHIIIHTLIRGLNGAGA